MRESVYERCVYIAVWVKCGFQKVEEVDLPVVESEGQLPLPELGLERRTVPMRSGDLFHGPDRVLASLGEVARVRFRPAEHRRGGCESHLCRQPCVPAQQCFTITSVSLLQGINVEDLMASRHRKVRSLHLRPGSEVDGAGEGQPIVLVESGDDGGRVTEELTAVPGVEPLEVGHVPLHRYNGVGEPGSRAVEDEEGRSSNAWAHLDPLGQRACLHAPCHAQIALATVACQTCKAARDQPSQTSRSASSGAAPQQLRNCCTHSITTRVCTA